MDDIKVKLSSRKFWVALAAMLASIGTSIGGLATANETLTTVGVVCLIVSQAIYSFAEAYVDAASVKSKTVTVSATTSNATTAATLAGVSKESTNG